MKQVKGRTKEYTAASCLAFFKLSNSLSFSFIFKSAILQPK